MPLYCRNINFRQYSKGRHIHVIVNTGQKNSQNKIYQQHLVVKLAKIHVYGTLYGTTCTCIAVTCGSWMAPFSVGVCKFYHEMHTLFMSMSHLENCLWLCLLRYVV